MSDITARLGLPLLAASQAQKHVTVNEALARLDLVVQVRVIDRDLTAPPSDPEPGDNYIVGAGATGEWVDRDSAVACFDAGAWVYLTPLEGWLVWVAADEMLCVFSNGAWRDLRGSELQNLTRFGFGTEADEGSPFAVKLNNALWTARAVSEDGTGDLRLTMNKEAGANVLSLLMQSAYSGRAEIGLTGDEDFVFKVSADGSVWREAIRIDRSTGRPRFPQGGVREMLTGDRTYHVRSDGSDANSGFTDSAGGAFQTLQHAYDVIASDLDLAGFIVTIAIGAGTFAGFTANRGWVGGGGIVLDGAGATTILSGTGHLVSWTAPLPGELRLKDLKLTTTGSGDCIRGEAPGRLMMENLEFGASAGRHVVALGGGARIDAAGNYRISGGATNHWFVQVGGSIVSRERTITLTGTPAFTAFASAAACGTIQTTGTSFSGSATGSRYSVSTNGVIRTGNSGPSHLPGNSGGLATTGGQYA